MRTTETVTPGGAHIPGGPRGTCLPPQTARLEGSHLVVPPFRIRRGRQRFVQRETLRIDLESLEPDVYRVLAVQNFWAEDHNAVLAECAAAVFLARRLAGGGWECPEAWPVECRTLGTLGVVDARHLRWVAHEPE